MVPLPIQRVFPSHLQPFSVDLLSDVYVKWLQRTLGRMFHLGQHVIFLFIDKSIFFPNRSNKNGLCDQGVDYNCRLTRCFRSIMPQSPGKHYTPQMTQFAAIKAQSQEDVFFVFLLSSPNSPNPIFLSRLWPRAFVAKHKLRLLDDDASIHKQRR